VNGRQIREIRFADPAQGCSADRFRLRAVVVRWCYFTDTQTQIVN
jgi:hypothetical protein